MTSQTASDHAAEDGHHHLHGHVEEPTPAAQRNAHLKSMAEYQEMYDRSINDPNGFWSEIANQFYWKTPFDPTNVVTSNLDTSNGQTVSIKWFEGGQTNICYNALDRHIENGLGDRIAFHWEGNDAADSRSFTYQEVYDQVCRLANVLRSYGVRKGDCVSIYLPMIIELPVTMLACARIGAMHSVVFGGFSSVAFAVRLLDSKPKVIITADGVFRGDKWIPLKETTDEAIALAEKDGYVAEHVLVVERHGPKCPHPVHFKEGRDACFTKAVSNASNVAEVEWVDSEHPLFMLYTSGSTGKPKGVLHTTGGYMIYASTTFKYVFDYHPEDIYWCTADCGWITGHSYVVYGPMSLAATSVLHEGIPTYPHVGRFWEIVEKRKVNQFYTAPTVIRSLMRYGDAVVQKHDRSSLRILGSVGEPINPEAWLWYFKVVGNGQCAIVDTYWQTETGGHVITPLPGCTPMKPGSATLPFFGVQPVVLDSDGHELAGAASGYLVMKAPWPGMLRTIYNDHRRFEEGYFGMFKGYYLTGDGCRRDEDGYIWITGRIDDVLNVSGHRLGTAEVESSLGKHESVVESAVVGYPHPIKGEGIYVYVTLREGFDFGPAVIGALKAHVRSDIGAFAQPDVIHFAPGLPKTRSGKIMRRILRKIAEHEEGQLGDISTLADPSVVSVLIANRSTAK